MPPHRWVSHTAGTSVPMVRPCSRRGSRPVSQKSRDPAPSFFLPVSRRLLVPRTLGASTLLGWRGRHSRGAPNRCPLVSWPPGPLAAGHARPMLCRRPPPCSAAVFTAARKGSGAAVKPQRKGSREPALYEKPDCPDAGRVLPGCRRLGLVPAPDGGEHPVRDPRNMGCPSNKMALSASDCGAMCSPSIKWP